MPVLILLLNIVLVKILKFIGFSMQEKKIQIRLVESWPVDDIVELYKTGGWWKDSYDKTGIPSLISGSFAFAVAVDNNSGKAVGMGRILSDGVSDAYIQDVVVLPPFRKQNVGKHLVRTLLDYCISKNIHWIGLIAEPGNDQFYTSLGFRPMKQYKPMLYHTEE